MSKSLSLLSPRAVEPAPAAINDFFKADRAAMAAQDAGGPSLTRQEFADDCDLNILMKRFENRDIGAIMRAAGEPVYYDFTTMPDDLQGYMRLMGDAENAFMSLPATVRREFDNDPVAFVDFAADSSNLDRMREWGLAPPLPASEAAPVTPPVSSEPAPPPAKDGGT